MISRRLVFFSSILATAVSFFTLGLIHSRSVDASARAAYDARLDALRAELHQELGKEPAPAGMVGETSRGIDRRAASRARIVAEIKEELQSEMGLLPVQLLRERRTSFVELYA